MESNFIITHIEKDIEAGKHQIGDSEKGIHTRFPPEPNGYLHIGHAKSICLNFGLAEHFKGLCNLRLDDSNPSKEETEYVESIKEDVKWLGFDWGDRLFFASDYFDRMFELAQVLIKEGKAYVCSLSAEETREYRGSLKAPGKDSPYRERSVEENLELFQRMQAGEFEEGEHILRAKIDMASPNINLRDPALYRIKKAEHHRTGDKWNVYPMYDYCHCLSDAFEGVSHSICTLEFEDHRPLYDWILEQLPVTHPRQIEFARLNLTYTVLSKRKLLQLVEEGHLEGWDDPRMPTISGMRRRGYTPSALREFCDRIGVAKADSTVDRALLEFCQREELNSTASRRMVVKDPIKLIVTNFPEGETESLEADNNPEDQNAGKRLMPFSRELWIEREDFEEVPPRKWRRLTPGKEVRLVNAYYVTCTDFKKDADGNVTEVHCTYDPQTKGGWSEDGRKVKGSIHWVNAETAGEVELRLFDYLFKAEEPGKETGNFIDDLNPESRVVVESAKCEPELLKAEAGQYFQFLRDGYYTPDGKDSGSGKLVFNRTVALRDSKFK